MCKWTWDQEHDEITLTIDITATKNDIKVIPTTSSLKVYLKDDLIMDKEFSKPISPSDVVWYLDKGLIIQITKKENEWWDCVFIGDEKIDVNEVASSRPIGLDNLDDEARMTVEKMMYEQKCKANGVETDEDVKKKEIMEMINKSKKEDK